jgi:serine/threonine-protein kinase
VIRQPGEKLKMAEKDDKGKKNAGLKSFSSRIMSRRLKHGYASKRRPVEDEAAEANQQSEASAEQVKGEPMEDSSPDIIDPTPASPDSTNTTSSEEKNKGTASVPSIEKIESLIERTRDDISPASPSKIQEALESLPEDSPTVDPSAIEEDEEALAHTVDDSADEADNPDNTEDNKSPSDAVLDGVVTAEKTPIYVEEDMLLWEPKPGDNITDSVTLDKAVGLGATSEVWLGHEENLNIQVAVKIIRPELQNVKLVEERFLHEARRIASLNHTNILKVYSCGRKHGRAYIVTEYIKGLTLDTLMKDNGPLPFCAVLEAICCATVALGHASKRSILHRDIKPDNLMVSVDGEVKVMDFGVATSITNDTDSISTKSFFLGTPMYMAPELREQPKEIGVEVDIYALGVTLYRLLTGHFLFNPDESVKTMADVLNRQHTSAIPRIADSVKGATKSVDKVLERMLAKDPKERYSSYRHLFLDLMGLLHESDNSSLHESWGRGYYSSMLGDLVKKSLLKQSTELDSKDA